MKAVVPAAGEGTRLRPLTEDRPKGLVAVGGRPLLAHCFDRLCEVGVKELVVVVGYRGSAIVDCFGDSYWDVPITYVQQRERKGLAHALLTAEDHVAEDFLVCNGDNVLQSTLKDVVDRQRDPAVDATLFVERVSTATARTTSVVEVEDEARVVDMVEKPDDPLSTLVSVGVFALPPAVFDACRLLRPSDRGEYELSTAIAVLSRAGYVVETVTFDGWRINVNTPADVERAERELDGR